jgi:Na+-driven multidrug efflux pump
VFVLFVFFARHIASLFSKDAEVVAGTTRYLRIVSLAYGLQGMMFLSVSVLNIYKKPIQASVISIVQMFALCVPMAFAGSALFGLNGVFGSIAISYAFAGGIAWWYLHQVMGRGEDGTGQRTTLIHERTG